MNVLGRIKVASSRSLTHSLAALPFVSVSRSFAASACALSLSLSVSLLLLLSLSRARSLYLSLLLSLCSFASPLSPLTCPHLICLCVTVGVLLSHTLSDTYMMVHMYRLTLTGVESCCWS